MPDPMVLYVKWMDRIWKNQGIANYTVVAPCGRGERAARECFPEEASKTTRKKERVDIERDWKSL